jgi:TPR repeat protein
MLIFEDRSGVQAVCGSALLILLIALATMAGRDQARAEGSSLLDFFSLGQAEPALNSSPLGGLVPWADDMKKAREAYARGAFEEARGYLEPAAQNGDITASLYLGHMYRLGRGVEASTLKSLQYYQNVAEAFTPLETDRNRLRMMIHAMVQVADIYRLGDPDEGVKSNSAVAFQLYATASSYGDPSAQYAQGLMWLEGDGVKASPVKAVRWLVHAAKKRHPAAQALLGDLYWKGKGEVLKRDRIQALTWYKLAVQSARPEEHPKIFDDHDSMDAQVTPEQRAEAEKRALAWDKAYPVPPPPHGAWPEGAY